MRPRAWLLALGMLSAVPAEAQPRRPIVVLSLPGLSVRDVAPGTMPRLHRLAREGTVALANVVTRASFAPDRERWDPVASAYLTLGMGGRGYSPPVFFPLTGQGVQFPVVRALGDLNQGGTRVVEPGFLGTSLRRAGLKSAALGCADTWGRRDRAVLLAAMDAAGAVDFGDVSQRCLRADPARPYGWISDAGYLTETTLRLRGRAALIWVDPGDLQRAERYATLCRPAVARAHRQAALAQADRIAGALRDRTGGALIVLAPAGRVDEERTDRWLTPFIQHTPGAPPGLLASGSTRRAGLIAMTDLAGSLLGELAGPAARAPNLLGTVPARDAWAHVLALEADTARADALRRTGIRVVQGLLLVIALLAALAAWFRWACPNRIALLPLALGWACLLVTVGGPSLQALGLGVAAAAALLLGRLNRALQRSAGVAYAFLALAVLAELLPGGRALTGSTLGYSLSLGARYYGMGNEWMGVLLGATLAALALLLPSNGASSVGPALATGTGVLLVLVVVLGSPAAGADLGGALTAAVTAGAFCYLRAPRQWRARVAAGGTILAAFLLAMAITWDALRPPVAQTHLARLLDDLRGGLDGLAAAIGAKLALNWRVSLSFWGLLLLVETAALWLLGSRSSGEDRRILGVATLFTVAGLVSLVFNDSGALASVFLLSFSGAAVLGASPRSLEVPGRNRLSTEAHKLRGEGEPLSP